MFALMVLCVIGFGTLLGAALFRLITEGGLDNWFYIGLSGVVLFVCYLGYTYNTTYYKDVTKTANKLNAIIEEALVINNIEDNNTDIVKALKEEVVKKYNNACAEYMDDSFGYASSENRTLIRNSFPDMRYNHKLNTITFDDDTEIRIIILQ